MTGAPPLMGRLHVIAARRFAEVRMATNATLMNTGVKAQEAAATLLITLT